MEWSHGVEWYLEWNFGVEFWSVCLECFLESKFVVSFADFGSNNQTQADRQTDTDEQTDIHTHMTECIMSNNGSIFSKKQILACTIYIITRKKQLKLLD